MATDPQVLKVIKELTDRLAKLEGEVSALKKKPKPRQVRPRITVEE